jgi:hypothetical protein
MSSIYGYNTDNVAQIRYETWDSRYMFQVFSTDT